MKEIPLTLIEVIDATVDIVEEIGFGRIDEAARIMAGLDNDQLRAASDLISGVDRFLLNERARNCRKTANTNTNHKETTQ